MAEEVDPALRGLEPRILWEQFDAIRKIPRPSLHEELVRQYMRGLAADNGWTVHQDSGGNIVLKVAARGRGVGKPALAIQGHMDMVCAKDPGTEHDFHRDPISLRRGTLDIDGVQRPVVTAVGTTLGSDNGLGLAAALAIALDPSVDHPPLELLFTADEETGMTGAFALDGKMLTARRLLNLDAEEQGSIYLSCAGGRELSASWGLSRDPPRAEDVALRLRLSGLRGGHSGVDIHDKRGNAIVLLLQLMSAEGVELDGVRFASCDGGARPNAIPRNAQAVVWCPPNRATSLEAQLRAAADQRAAELSKTEPGFEFVVERVDGGECPHPVGPDVSRAVLRTLARLTDGVVAWSPSIDGLVETSSNMGVLETTEQQLNLICLARSSRDGAVEVVQERMRLALESSGASTKFYGEYPGWEAKLDNPLLARARVVYEDLFGEAPHIKAIHAGLECGILKRRIPGIEMIAFGPEIRNAHTPDEALVVDTVEPFWRLVSGLVRDLCQ